MKNKKKQRVKLYLSMNAELYEQFEKIVYEKCIDKSLLIDVLIREWLINNNNEK